MNNTSQQYFLSTLQKYVEIPESEWKKMAGILKSLHLENNEFFIMEGDKPDRLAMIISGIFRIFCITETGDDKTLAFRTKGQFLSAFTPFIENKDTWYSIQALSPSDLLYFSIEDGNKLSPGHPCWEILTKEYIIQLFIEKEDRERSFLTEDAETRYLRFKGNYPELERSIYQFHIASYLGISPVSLSRIRGKLKKSAN